MGSRRVRNENRFAAGVRGSSEGRVGPFATRAEVGIDLIDEPHVLCRVCRNLYATQVARQEVRGTSDPLKLCQPCSKPFFAKRRAEREEQDRWLEEQARLQRERQLKDAASNFARCARSREDFQQVAFGRDGEPLPIGIIMPNGAVVHVNADRNVHYTGHEIRTAGGYAQRVSGAAEFVELRIPETRVMIHVSEFVVDQWVDGQA